MGRSQPQAGLSAGHGFLFSWLPKRGTNYRVKSPGAFVGLIAAFGVHDIDLWVTDIANFVFYFVVAWLLLKAFGRSKTLDT